MGKETVNLLSNLNYPQVSVDFKERKSTKKKEKKPTATGYP